MFAPTRLLTSTSAATAACCLLPAAALAYTSTFRFDSFLEGQNRSYAAGSRSISFTSAATNNNRDGFTDTFTVKLYRSQTGTDAYIGKFTARRVGSSRQTWTNLSAGSYHYTFSKSPGDGVWLTSNNVVMK